MRYRQQNRPRAFLPACVPDEVKSAGVLWAPDETEILLSNALVRQRLLEQELRERELLEQREWLAQQGQRLAQIAAEIDEYKRLAMIEAEMQKREAWWAETAEREKEQNESVLKFFQDQLDGNLHRKMLDRAAKAAEDIRRTDARIERNELRRRGVLKGRRT
jgi:hypothetical protein